MMDVLSLLFYWANIPANAIGGILLAPVGVMPGWLSSTSISAMAGLVLLIIFKYTSNQAAIAGIRNTINANMLAMKLFKDNFSVTLKAQGQLFKCAFLLLFQSVLPLLVMMVPVTLLLAQMGLWYQHRPLQIGEETIVTLELLKNNNGILPEVSMVPNPSIEIVTGPVRVFSKKEVSWKIKVLENGNHHLMFHMEGRQVEKKLAVGNGFMRISGKRPGLYWADIILNPLEKPFEKDAAVQAVSITYPERQSFSSGTDMWVVYFFIVSLVFALIFKPFLNVKI